MRSRPSSKVTLSSLNAHEFTTYLFSHVQNATTLGTSTLCKLSLASSAVKESGEDSRSVELLSAFHAVSDLWMPEWDAGAFGMPRPIAMRPRRFPT